MLCSVNVIEDSPDVLVVQAGELGSLHTDMGKVLPLRMYSPSLQSFPVCWVPKQIASWNAESFALKSTIETCTGRLG